MIEEKEIGTTKTVKFTKPYFDDLDSLELLDREDLLDMVKKMVSGGVVLSFHGKRTAQEIDKKVRPRQTRVIKNLCVGSPEEQSRNMIIEGENLQAMVTLYKYRGQVDLIITDPPYNTGQFFRYNDRWDLDPNDPELGTLVTLEDGSRHTKWMKAMMPRLNMMKAMLKPGGVIAMCIDENELFHLGMMMDEVFKEDNRIAIINWQKSYSPKNQDKHVSTGTEYILVYARDKSSAKTEPLPRSEAMDARYKAHDDDPEGPWKGMDPTAAESRKKTVFGIQSPFTGVLHYPEDAYSFDGRIHPPRRHWAMSKKEIKVELEKFGTKYVEKDLGDGRGSALVLKGASITLDGYNPETDPVVPKARERAETYCRTSTWPRFCFLADKQKRFGFGRPFIKSYLKAIKQGRVPMTFWADDNYDEPLALGVQSWSHAESGHSQTGINELDAVMGKGHGFQTVKPLKLFKKIIHLWCPPSGLVLDTYAGSGTTGHAILELNKEIGTNRRFILVEQGQPDKGDKYARSLTQERLRRAITGERPDSSGNLLPVAEPLGGGFEFRMLTRQIDAKTVLSMKRDELIDVVITSHWATNRRGVGLIRIDDSGYSYLVGKDDLGEGYFVIWNGAESVGKLDEETYVTVLQEAKRAGLKPPYHVYARYEEFQSRNVDFNKIPDKILAHLGLNENSDRFHEEDEA